MKVVFPDPAIPITKTTVGFEVCSVVDVVDDEFEVEEDEEEASILKEQLVR